MMDKIIFITKTILFSICFFIIFFIIGFMSFLITFCLIKYAVS
ncbi:unnamed protein product [marine sediment metagenome]|uniref:Uncharacterized protein n=1 Tax=marine sediment metagenome TaxID=412755 RepID=X1HUM6_9ZZZZ